LTTTGSVTYHEVSYASVEMWKGIKKMAIGEKTKMGINQMGMKMWGGEERSMG